jgi:hypothetical protein
MVDDLFGRGLAVDNVTAKQGKHNHFNDLQCEPLSGDL